MPFHRIVRNLVLTRTLKPRAFFGDLVARLEVVPFPVDTPRLCYRSDRRDRACEVLSARVYNRREIVFIFISQFFSGV